MVGQASAPAILCPNSLRLSFAPLRLCVRSIFLVRTSVFPGRGLFPEQPAQDLAHQALGQLGAEFDDFGDFVERQLLAAEVPNLLDVEFDGRFGAR